MWIKQLVFVLLAFPSIALGQENLEHDVKNMIIESISISNADVNVNLPLSSQLQACKEPIPFLPRGVSTSSQRVTLGVKCTNMNDLYLQIQVDIHVSYAIALSQIERGKIIEKNMLGYGKGLLSALPRNSVFNTDDLIGKASTRNIQTGSPIRETDVMAPHLVSRGDRVEVVARGAGFVIKQSGIAQSQGGQGEQVRVSLDNRQVIEASVIGPGRLEATR